MLSTDENALDPKSATGERMKKYRALVDELRVVVVRARHPLASLSRVCSGMKKVDQSGDWIVTSQDPFELGIIALLISRWKKIPLHVQVHIDFFSPYFKKESFRQCFQAKIAPFVLRRADAIRAVSSKIAAYLENDLRIGKMNTLVAPIFVASTKIGATPVTIDLHKEFPQFKFIFLAASRFVKQKNIPFAISAFGKFASERKDVGFVIVGSGPEEKSLRSIISKEGLDSKIKIGLWKNEFFSCMKTADAFLLSSDYEGWGMTIVEAAAAGKPIIMTDVGCAGEFIHNGENGLIVPVRNENNFVLALNRIYTDKALRESLSRSATLSATRTPSSDEYEKLLLDSWNIANMNHR